MVLAAGSRLGVYEVVGALGAGGMGEVYRARDTKLNRDVAIKILPDTFASDADRVARFTREAQTLAALNHPHIAQIYGLEESSGVRALVMELVEGEDLAQRIARGPIPVDEAIAIAKQIADALEAAHEKGIIHRDLKPANVKLTPEGTIKVLDFGLAKPAVDELRHDAALSPTFAAAATQMGMIVGTAAYMAPEQARGRSVDKRADIWAFGCVVYEMLTGRPPFAGESVTEMLAAVIHKEIDWTALPVATPPAVRSALRRCLQKDPARRLRHIGDVFLEPDDGVTERHISDRRLPVKLAGAALLLGAAIGVVASTVLWPRSGPPDTATSLMFELPPVVTPGVGAPRGGVISPDGSLIAYGVQNTLGDLQLAVRSLKDGSVRVVDGTEGAHDLFWSPDSRWVGFFANRKLKRVDLAGAKPEQICDAPLYGRGASWSRDDVIIFTAGDGGILRVSATGGPPIPIARPSAESGEVRYRWPSFLPDGKLFYVAVDAAHGTDFIGVGSLASDRVSRVVDGYSAAAVSNGTMLFVRDGTLFAAPVDETTGRLTGPARVLIPEISYQASQGAASFSVSDTGVLAYALPTDNPTNRFSWHDTRGRLIGEIDHESVLMPGGGFSLDPSNSRRLEPGGRSGPTRHLDFERWDHATGRAHAGDVR